MNKILIVSASDSDSRLMSGLFVKYGYEPIAVENMEAAKDVVAQLLPARGSSWTTNIMGKLSAAAVNLGIKGSHCS